MTTRTTCRLGNKDSTATLGCVGTMHSETNIGRLTSIGRRRVVRRGRMRFTFRNRH